MTSVTGSCGDRDQSNDYLQGELEIGATLHEH